MGNGHAAAQQTVRANEFERIADLVGRIREGDRGGEDELYAVLSGGIRFLLMRSLGSIEDAEDRLHEVLVIVVNAIREDRLNDPERLMGYIHTVVRCQIATVIDARVAQRKQQVSVDDQSRPVRSVGRDPEQIAIQNEQMDCAIQLLNELKPRDRELLRRFYLLEQPKDRIMADMGLNETQFRLFRSRAKARYDELL